MKTTLKRLTALILALSLALSLFSTGAWAADLTEDTSPVAVQSEEEPQAEAEAESEESEPEEEPEAPAEDESEPEAEPEAEVEPEAPAEDESEPEEEPEVEPEAVEEVEPEEEAEADEPEAEDEESARNEPGMSLTALAADNNNAVTQDAVQAVFTEGGTAKLGDNITLTSALTVPPGKNVTLDLNGFVIRRDLSEAKKNGYVISNEGTLTITDSNKTR